MKESDTMPSDFSTLIIIKPDDFKRLAFNYKRLVQNLPSKQLLFVSSAPIKEYITEAELGDNVGFLDESSILPFADVHKVLSEHMKDILGEDELPRGATGWYYQQFLKMLYAYQCPDEYYMVWDGDTIPCKPFSMFQEGTEAPYMDLKHEYHEEYFVTLGKLLPGMKKCIKKSFISEHMLFHCGLMKELIETIESNETIPGKTFWEKIIHAIPPTKIANSAFSEFETYGTFVCFHDPIRYKLREWHSFRLAGEFFDPDKIDDEDFAWLGKDFHAVSFEKNQFVREDNKNLFDNKEYQKKLSARKMLEIAQEEFNGGYIEVWGDGDDYLPMDPLAAEQKNSIFSMPEYEFYEKLGDSYLNTNINQAFLCYENAEFLCHDSNYKNKLSSKLEDLKTSGKITVKPTAISIVSYNNKEIMKQCIWSIEEHCAPSAYSLVITDNASTDGIAKWLESRADNMTVILSDTNLGFPGGCNVCIQYAEPGQDILLLNNDTRMTHNALFWLRMGLYEDDSIGATGCISNFAGNEQMVPISFQRPEEYVTYAKKNNIQMKNPYEEKSRLCGFAMLIRRNILDEIGGLDEAFSPGYFEDDDLSLRIREKGYRLVVCHNSFIYHIGSKSFKKNDALDAILERNYTYTQKKWGFDNLSSAVISEEEKQCLNDLKLSKDKPFRLLEIGCGNGNFLSSIKFNYPKAQLWGLTNQPKEIIYGVSNIPILYIDEEFPTIPLPDHYLDYIIINEERQKKFPAEALQQKLTSAGKIYYLKEQ